MFNFLRKLLRWLGLLKKEREWLLWVSDQWRAPEALGKPVDFHGRKGRCVRATELTILVEWDD